jgi:hypothetical protein
MNTTPCRTASAWLRRSRLRYLAPLLLTPALAGCGLTNAISLSPNVHMPTHKRLVHKPKLAPIKAPARIPGELDTGSASHALTVNGVQLVLNYWSDQDAAEWTPSSQGTINASVQVQGLQPGIIARVTSFQVVAPPSGPRAHNSILVNDAGEFVVGAPYSYGSAFVMPDYVAGTKLVTLHIYVALEIETKPESGAYTRQSVVDTLQVATVPKNTNARVDGGAHS